MCIQNAKNYDVCCQVDSGKIKLPTKAMCEEMKAYEQSPYFKYDQAFISSLIFRISTQSINDAELKRCFESYTQLMVDLTRG